MSTINRETAINTVFSMLCKWDTNDPEDLKNMLLLAFQEMPSAQPELCEDAVSREAVLDKAYAYGNGLEPEGYCVNVEDIQALPSVQPERKTGKWIEVENKWGGLEIRCSECGAKVPRDEWRNAMQCNYCPHCGARMRGESDECM